MDGVPKRLRDLPPDMTRRGMFVAGGLIEYGTEESGEFVLPVEGGAPRRLPVETRPLNGVPSEHGAARSQEREGLPRRTLYETCCILSMRAV